MSNPINPSPVTVKFYQDIKVTVWKRQYFSITGKSKESVLEKAATYCREDASWSENIDMQEELHETESPLHPHENNGWSTIKLYAEEEGRFIGSNGE